MNFIIFCIYIPLVHSEVHTFITTYTEINEQMIVGIPEISSVTKLDGRQIDYYDGETKKLIPKQDWMKEFASRDIFKKYTEIREQVQQTNKINITILMEQLNQSHGVHTYQRMYGCDWDDKTSYSNWFDEHGYDGEDFISLDVENSRYNTAVPQGFKTAAGWNEDRAQLNNLRRYYRDGCVYWLSYFLGQKKVDLERRAPEVSLLQKSPFSPVSCHATGFYPSAVTVTWLKNGEEHYEDVEFGELLPNEDGTFQKTLTLYVTQNKWKKDHYVCVVEHQEKTIRKILIEDEIKSNISELKSYRFEQHEGPTKPYFTIPVHVIYICIVILIVLLIGTCIIKKKSVYQRLSSLEIDSEMYVDKSL